MRTGGAAGRWADFVRAGVLLHDQPSADGVKCGVAELLRERGVLRMQALPVAVFQDPGLGHVIRIVRSDGDKDQVTVACVGGRPAKAPPETKDLWHMLGFEHGPTASVPRPGV